MSYTLTPAPLRTLIGEQFYGVHSALRKNEYGSYWLRGGRGSLKSSFVAIQTLLDTVQDPMSNTVALRKVAGTIKDSLLPTYEWAIRVNNWEPFFEVLKGDATITYLPTGQQILLRGLDDPLKYKSMKAKKGYFKNLWFEEAAEFDGMEEIRSVQQSVLRGGPVFRDFTTFNPPREPKHWINVEVATPTQGRLVHSSCYTHSPPEWLGPRFLKDAEDAKRDKPEVYAHEYLGIPTGRSDAIVFSGCYRVERFEPEFRKGIQPDAKGDGWFIGDERVEGPYYGADWGFSQDPTTLLKCWVSSDDKKVFVEREKFAIGLTFDEMPEWFEKLDPTVKTTLIRADCARPETIAHMKSRKFRIEGAEKWKGSVEDGIEWLRGRKIIIHDRCTNLQNEAVMYQYKVDRWTKEIRSDLVDAHNHGWDAIRYALQPLIKKRSKGIMGFDL